jgi:DNA-binding NarL/FixJ family response regulator
MPDEPKPVSIFVAEDDALLRDLLTQLLSGHEDFVVLGVAGNGAQALEAVGRLQPDVLLLDLGLPQVPGQIVLERLAAVENAPRVLVLSGTEDEGTQLEAARAGARGFLQKSQACMFLPEAVRKVAAGEAWFSSHILGLILNEYPVYVRRVRHQEGPAHQLSQREREVLVRVARGKTNQQIADDLFLSVSTVKVHIRNIFDKLNLPNRTEAAVFAVREGLLEQAASTSVQHC